MDASEKNIQAIIGVLEEEESHLSDGYGYYCNDVKDTLRRIAVKIISEFRLSNAIFGMKSE